MASEPKRPIPAATFGRNFGRYKDQAIADGVVEISHHGRLVGAYLSKSEYSHFLSWKQTIISHHASVPDDDLAISYNSLER